MQPNKKILFGDDARSELKKGIDTVANAVKLTLGPVGRNASISRGYRSPIITNDGVSIAQSIKLKDNFQQMGVAMAQEVAQKTDSVAGDGTTTTLILLQAIINTGLNQIKKDTNVMEVKRGIEEEAARVVEELKNRAVKVESLDKIIEVANISMENEVVARQIAETLYNVGEKGIVTVEEGDKKGVHIEVTEGMKINKGYASTYIVNNYEKMQGEYRDVPVLVTSKKVLSTEPIMHILEALNHNGFKQILIIADDIDGEALASFTLTKARGLMDIIPVRFPIFGEGKYDELEDIAIRCGTFVVGDKSAKQLRALKQGETPKDTDFTFEHLGFAKQVIVRRDTTVIIGGSGDITERVASLEKIIAESDDKDVTKHTTVRLGTLLSKAAVIKVGADTETERRYLKLKLDDAVNATRGAMEEGIVNGGGWELMSISCSSLFNSNSKDDRQLGKDILGIAITAPYKQLLLNCGVSKWSNEEIKGYNAKTGQFTDNLMAEGVVDPVKVTINAVTNAASAAGMFLTTEVIIADEEEEKNENA